MPGRDLAQVDAEQTELVVEFRDLCREVVSQHALECTGIGVVRSQDGQLTPQAGALLCQFRIDLLHHFKGTGDHAVFHFQNIRQRLIDNVQNAEQDEELQEHRQTGCAGVHVLFLVELHLLFLHLFRIILIFLPQLFHFRIDPLHSCGVLLLLIRDGEQDELGKNGEQQDRKCVVVHPVIDQAHDPAKRLSAQIV